MTDAPHVIFLSVKNNQQKILAICTVAEEYFQKEKNLLIAVANETSARYVDELLWRVPYFLPHAIISEPKAVPLAIAIAPESNLNEAAALLNLSIHITDLTKNFYLVYELMDFTSEDREEKAKQRYRYYQQLGWKITVTD